MRSKRKQGRSGEHKAPRESKRGRLKRLIARATAERIGAEREALRLAGHNRVGRRLEEGEAIRWLKGVPTVSAIIASWRRQGART